MTLNYPSILEYAIPINLELTPMQVFSYCNCENITIIFTCLINNPINIHVYNWDELALIAGSNKGWGFLMHCI